MKKLLFIAGILLVYFNLNLTSILPFLTTRRLGLFVLSSILIFTFRSNMSIRPKSMLVVLGLIFTYNLIVSFFSLSFNYYLATFLVSSYLAVVIALILNSSNFKFAQKDFVIFVHAAFFINLLYLLISFNFSIEDILRMRVANREAGLFNLNSFFNQYIFIPVSYFFLFLSRNRKYIIYLILAMIPVFLSLSRQAIGASLLAMTIMYFYDFKPISAKTLWLVVLFYFFWQIQDIFPFIGMLESRFSTKGDSQRLESLRLGLNTFAKYPFGVGLGGFVAISQRNGTQLLESGFLQVLVELGFVLFGYFLCVVTLVLRFISKLHFDGLLRGYLYGLTGMYLAMGIVNEIFLTPIFIIPLVLIFNVKNLLPKSKSFDVHFQV